MLVLCTYKPNIITVLSSSPPIPCLLHSSGRLLCASGLEDVPSVFLRYLFHSGTSGRRQVISNTRSYTPDELHYYYLNLARST